MAEDGFAEVQPVGTDADRRAVRFPAVPYQDPPVGEYDGEAVPAAADPDGSPGPVKKTLRGRDRGRAFTGFDPCVQFIQKGR